MLMTRITGVRIIVFILLAPLAFLPVYEAQAQTKDVIDGARKEGQLVFYAGIPIPDAQAILSALEKKYPFIKTSFYRSTGAALVARIQTSSVPARISGT